MLGAMPKVSEAHRVARREQIIDAAMVRFAENGFQATGMADVIAATGMSAGAVYRYFKSKDELIEAIVDRVLTPVAHRFERLLDADSVPTPADAVRAGVETMVELSTDSPVDFGRVAVQAWAESLRSDPVSRIVSSTYSIIRGYYVEVSRRGVAAGSISADVDPEALGSALYSLMAGFVLQRVLFGRIDASSYAEAVTALVVSVEVRDT